MGTLLLAVSRCSGRIVAHWETGPEWVLAEISPVMSRYIRLARNGLSNIPRSNVPRVARLHLRLPAYLDGMGHPSRLLWLHPPPKLPLPLVSPGAVLPSAWALPKLWRMSWLPWGRSVLLRAGAGPS